ncbi:hypothetical protein H257_11310 [Aphanomyces astaci]|uniref:Uncharacterized protein n=1 Tax=Aphanomyces astaci TaxID=112090 RepID=W4G2R3_APHAT|nr:hypothetical protein H257_11310 [Aphanomyces astaci]ETV74002.1 hypothetical protein H257_11310 [Aphanomyces astaci]|eukprot:XP_009836515.1 hypothetical protein H257_11310 [Aphanomyces astaci]
MNQANGIVEVVNRLILPVVKTHTSELKLRATDWNLVLALVQAALNHMPSDRLCGMARLYWPVCDDIPPPRARSTWMSCMKQWNSCYVNWLRQATPSPRPPSHKQLQKFAIGDFVLIANCPAKATSCPCTGVAQASSSGPSSWCNHHACRLKMYYEGGCDVTEEIADHIACGNEGFLVAKLGAKEPANSKPSSTGLVSMKTKPHGSPCAPSMKTSPSFSATGFTNMKTKKKRSKWLRNS